MEEIIKALQNWEYIRKDSNTLKMLFSGKTGFELNMPEFAVGVPVHLYPAVKNETLFFVAISEEFDVLSPESALQNHCVWLECLSGLDNSQEISSEEALQRIFEWKNTSEQFIDECAASESGIFQTYYIPTNGLSNETYKVSFALKNDNGMKIADLVLKNNANLYFDTVSVFPPYRDRTKYYILDLL